MTFRRFKQILKRMYWLPTLKLYPQLPEYIFKFQWGSIMGCRRLYLDEAIKRPYSDICQLGLVISIHMLYIYISFPIIKKFTYYPE